MRLFWQKLVFSAMVMTVVAPAAPVSVRAESPALRKTWDVSPVPKQLRPLNLDSMMRGEKQIEEDMPTSRNVFEMLANGEELPQSKALALTADANDLRTKLRMKNSFSDLSEAQVADIRADLFKQEQENIKKQLERRNEFYIRHGLSDQSAKEFLATPEGRALKKEIRQEKEIAKKEAEAARKTEKTEAKSASVAPSAPQAAVDLVPAATPDENGKLQPFFYK
ncbi:MAG: hypothetical protein H6855_01120 [Rhodospirillales bacterium]|nr:hypothetical protein [Rhodospirillales bacterium]MCB9964670.1 hypothetical protein [Rhodospirillales bacterium]MCB9979960.1 hypothetical protein [Rhodospirillales bacterium]